MTKVEELRGQIVDMADGVSFSEITCFLGLLDSYANVARSEGVAAGAKGIIVLCGSTRFREQFESETRQLTLDGNIVLSLGVWNHKENIALPDAQNQALETLQLRKIRLASRVHVINVDGYIGASTIKEIAYAESLGKTITYLCPPVLAPTKEPYAERVRDAVTDIINGEDVDPTPD